MFRFILEGISRLMTESPEFHKKVQRYSWVVVLISAVSWLLKVFGVYEVPAEVNDFLNELFAVLTATGVTAAIVAKTAVKDGAAADKLVGGRPKDRE